MFAYFSAMLSLFDATIKALLGVEVLAMFFYVSLLFMALAVFAAFRSAAVGKGGGRL